MPTLRRSLAPLALILALLAPAVICHAAEAPAATTLAASAAEAKPLGIGTRVPAITVKTFEGSDLDLAAALDGKPTVLIIFRGGWCPYCSQHLAELAELEPKLIELGVQIVAISTDQPKNLRFIAEENKLHYRLLSDRGMTASSAFGVAYRVAPDMQKKYVEWQIDVPTVPGEPDHRWLPVPAAFVIGKDRVVKFVYADPDYTVRISGAKLLQAVHVTLK